jgi:hypothetical protein
VTGATAACSVRELERAVLAAIRFRDRYQGWVFRAVEVHRGWRLEARRGLDSAGTCVAIGTPDAVEAVITGHHLGRRAAPEATR